MQVQLGYMLYFRGAKYLGERIFNNILNESKRRGIDILDVHYLFHFYKGHMHLSSAEYDKAIFHYSQKFIYSTHFYCLNLACLGEAYSLKGDYLKAKEYIEKALKLMPYKGGKLEGILNRYYGEMFLHHEKLEEAKKYLHKSFEVFPKTVDTKDFAYVSHDLGIYYFKKKDIQKSIDSFLDAKEILMYKNYSLSFKYYIMLL